MAKKMKEYGAKVNNQLYPCSVNDEIYKNAGIAEACGFERPGANLDFNGVGDFAALKKAFAIIRINVRGTNASNGSKKRWSLWCVTTNLSTARVQLLTKKIGDYEIDKVSARRVTRYR